MVLGVGAAEAVVAGVGVAAPVVAGALGAGAGVAGAASFFLNGFAMRALVPLMAPHDFLRIAEESSVTSRSERVSDGGFRRTPTAARREALRRPATSRPHERGMVTMFAAANVAPSILLGAYHGMRLWCSWRCRRVCASGSSSRYHSVARAFAPKLGLPPSGAMKAVLTRPRQRAVVKELAMAGELGSGAGARVTEAVGRGTRGGFR